MKFDAECYGRAIVSADDAFAAAYSIKSNQSIIDFGSSSTLVLQTISLLLQERIIALTPRVRSLQAQKSLKL